MLEQGDKIGDYTLVRFLGRGQFGEVWLAEKELQFSKKKFQHALKFLFNIGDEINLKSAEAEIDTWIEASGHPNVMSVLDMLVHNNHIIIASEYAEGGSLKKWLTQSDGKAPSHVKALEMMVGILSGIEHLHSRNVVHRDLKPDNILLQNNYPRITDFGISRIISAGSMSTVAMGSPFYMSPESFDGSKSTQTDIWSAGVLLYEMLSGEHPYRSDTIFGLVTAIRQAQYKPLPEYIPPELSQIVDRALQKDLVRRYQTAQDMRWAVERQIYNLKMKAAEQVSDPINTVATPPADPNATFVDNYIDASLLSEPPSSIHTQGDAPLSKAKEADTEVLNMEESGDGSLATYIREAPIARDSQAVPSFGGTGSPNWTDPAPVPAGSSGEFHNSIPTAFAGTGEADHEVQPSPFSQTKRPLLVLGGIGGLMIFGVVFALVAVIAIVMVTRSWLSHPTEAGADLSAAKPGPKVLPASPSAPTGMAYVDGGEFMMGSDTGEVPDVRPAHKVSLAPYFMDIYEITNEQYAEFMKSEGHKPPQGWKSGTYTAGEARYPVVGVDWEDARAYAAWAGKRLPTEAEWELAARGKEGLLYPWGNEWRSGNANVDKASATLSEVDKFASGRSVYGIFAMVGNAGEWTADDFGPYPGGSLSAYYTGKKGLKTIRGTDYKSEKKYATTTYRIGYEPTGGSYDLTGFRCAKDVEK